MRAAQFVSVLGLSLAVASVAAAEAVTLQHTSRTPAAQGTVELKPQKGGNQKVSIQLKHIAQPQSMDPSLSSVVVWIEPGQGRSPVLAGFVPIDKNLNGKLETTVPYSSFNVLVTAEEAGTPQQPSQYVILRGQVAPAGQQGGMQGERSTQQGSQGGQGGM